MHHPRRIATLLTLLFLPSLLFAEMKLVDDDPIKPNLRFAWNLDLDGGVDGDEWRGFEIGFGEEVYPLDQMIITYSYEYRANEDNHQVMIGFEEYYPITDSLVPYGVAGFGYRRNDPGTPSGVKSDGWFGKIGFGIILKPVEALSFYGEVAYLAGEDGLWRDGDSYASHNLTALLGIRFSY